MIKYLEQNRISQILFFILIFILFLLAALRSVSVGNDTITYMRIFDRISQSSLHNDFSTILSREYRIESGYLALNYICNYLFSSFQSVLIICAIITYWGYWNFIRKYSYTLLLSLFIFFCLRYSDSAMNIIRQSLAIVITLKAYDEIKENNIIKYILLICLALLFHHSAIFFLPAWWICKYKLSKKIVLLSTLISILVMYATKSASPIILELMGDYSSYMDTKYVEEGKIAPTINVIMYSLILLFVWLSKKNETSSTEYEDDFNRMCSLTFVGIMILIVSLSNALIFRIAVYYYIYVIVLIPNAIKNLHNKTNKLFFTSLIVILLASFYIVIITLRPDWNRIYPYSFYWE